MDSLLHISDVMDSLVMLRGFYINSVVNLLLLL